MKTIWKMVPGLAMALVIAAAAKGLEYLEGLAGLHLIGASVIALFIGMVINRFFKPNAVTSPGIRFTSKKVLKLAIILLGASLKRPIEEDEEDDVEFYERNQCFSRWPPASASAISSARRSA